ncbi:MAG: hypothetical protein AAFU41_09875 [Pseudomonadota bacterium]
MTPRIFLNSVDQYWIDKAPYHFESSDDKSACFRREDGSGALEWFTWEELQDIVGSDRWDWQRRSIPVAGPKRNSDPFVFIWELTDSQRKLLLYRWFFVDAIEKLRAKKLIKLTPDDVIKNYYRIHTEASAAWRAFCGEFGKQYYCSKDTSLGATPSASSMLLWRRKVSDADGRLEVLLDQRGRSSGLAIDQESFRFITEKLREYQLDDQHNKSEVIENTIRAVRLENERRDAEGRPLLETRSRSALFEWKANFGGFAIDVGRKGKQYAVRKYSGVGKTERATRAGQTFMVDEWEVDARNIALSGPIRVGLDQKTVDILKSMQKTRRWMYVVMDVATRYIVGFLLSATQNSEAAVRALRMATHDKTDLAKAAGCERDWHGFNFEALENDTGAAFIAADTQRAVRTANATYTYPQVGQPQLRGIIERMFLTFSERAMPYIPGRTFRDPKTRGDYNTEGRAVLTDDQLATIFIRYIVDVYHQTKHAGLLGETPENALKRLSGTTGLPPKLSPKARRRAFGIRQERKIANSGIRFMGIDYGGNCSELLGILKAADPKERSFYVDPEDLGTISVWADGNWIEVGCSVERFHGIRLVDWIAVGKILRQRYSAQAELNTSVILAALADMRKRSHDAQKIFGVLPQMYTAEDLDRLERELYWGLSVIDDTPPAVEDLPTARDGIGYVIGNTNSDDPIQAQDGHNSQPSRLDQIDDADIQDEASEPLDKLDDDQEGNVPPTDDVEDDDGPDWWKLAGDDQEAGSLPKHATDDDAGRNDDLEWWQKPEDKQ